MPELLKKKAALMAKKERLENKMLDSLVSDQDFFRLNEKLKTELKAMEEEINAANTTENAYWKHYFSRFENLKNISQIFHSGDVQMKQNFIKIGFGEKISYNGAIYRTAFLHPIFEPKTLIMSKKDLLKLHKKTGISEKPPLRVEAITITKHLNALLDWLDQAAA
ncbi:MAG TPA: hypothetical protein PLA69_06915 [Flavobacterium sp.]|nr:hypothetical protein [Flavobacterium sp.]